mgnify:CR=1 FL=1
MTSGSLSDILKKIITTQTQQFAKETLKKSTICCQKEQGLINTQLNNNNLGYLLRRLGIIGGWEKALQGDNTVLKCSFYYISVWQGQQIRRPGDVYH